MPVDLFVERTKTRLGEVRLKPIDELGEAALIDMAVPRSGILRCKLTGARDIVRHRAVWKMLAMTAECLGDDWDVEGLRMWLQIRCGSVRVFDVGGVEVRVPRSWRFSQMDEAEFAALTDRMVREIVTHLFPLMDPARRQTQRLELMLQRIR